MWYMYAQNYIDWLIDKLAYIYIIIYTDKQNDLSYYILYMIIY